MSSTLRSSQLIELATSSISYDKQVQSGCLAFDRQMYEIIDETGVVIMIPNIMGIYDSNLIDILAWQFHVDTYDHTQTLETRKQLVQNSIQWHMTKGTFQLVSDVLNFFWPGAATLLEWYNYYDPLPVGLNPTTPPAVKYPGINSPPITPAPPGTSWHDRYRFRVYVDRRLIVTPEDEAAVLDLIERYKPISRWCEGLFRAIVSDCSIGWAGAMLRFVYRESEAPDYNPDQPYISPFQ